MKYLTTILVFLMCLYMGHVVWNVTAIFNPETCKENSKNCFTSLIHKDNRPWTLRVISSSRPFWKIKNIFGKTPIIEVTNFDFHSTFTKNINLTIPTPTRKNGSLHLHVVCFMPERPQEMVMIATTEISAYSVPVTYFQLMADANVDHGTWKKHIEKNVKPVTHLRPKVLFHVMSQDINLPLANFPPELHSFLRLDRSRGRYLPMLYINEMNYNTKDLKLVDMASTDPMQIEVSYTPLSIGMMRLWVTLNQSMNALKQFGFTDHDTDEVKGIFMDTNIYYLALTFFVSTFHILFDFLAFKHDVQYWKNRKSMEGLSSHTVIYRCVSTVIIFLYLVDKKTSLLVVIPTFIGSVIEIWKVTKAVKLRVTFVTWKPIITIDSSSEKEQTTGAFDQEAIKYLSYVLYPLSICGALYSLFYMPHISWYSWVIESLVNGVYAFGFLFMLPQLFINYKMKSVAHLPWKAFMYKAFNTFIDDVFAFIIRMPTSHRVACFRDDIVFFCYLYQRWLYPIDKTRVNEFGISYEEEADKKTN